MLWVEDAGAFKYHRIRHNVDLGADALSRCQHSRNDGSCYERLAEELRQAVKMPLDGAGSDVPGKIGGLCLLGEQATDRRVGGVLQRVLGEQVTSMWGEKPKNGR